MPVFTQEQVANTFLGLGVSADRIILKSNTYAGIDPDSFYKTDLAAFKEYMTAEPAPNGKRRVDYEIINLPGAEPIEVEVCNTFELALREWLRRCWFYQMNPVTPPSESASAPAEGGIDGPAPFNPAGSHTWGWFLALGGLPHFFETICNAATVEYPMMGYDFTQIRGVQG